MSERAEIGRPEISIIVPVYQVEKYLNECIDSILAQTFTDFELILVDDGSPDNCPALCDAAAKGQPRAVIHKQKRRSTARNALVWMQHREIDRVCGFMIQQHQNIWKKCGGSVETVQILQSAAVSALMKRAKRLRAENIAFLNEFFAAGRKFLRRMVVSDFQVPWNKLYRRKLLENLRYPENKAFEDTCLMPVIYARAASACGV